MLSKENGEEDCTSVQPLMPSGKRIRAIPDSWTSSFGKQFYAQEKSVTELQRQSEEDWMLRLEGQLFETGNKLHTPYLPFFSLLLHAPASLPLYYYSVQLPQPLFFVLYVSIISYNH